MAVVWVQSIVAQAHQLCDRTLLPSLDTVHSRLDTAAELLLAIDRLRRVRVEIKQTVLPPFASARAFKLAERIGDRLDPAMGKADLTDIHAAITELRGWTRQNEWQARYTADLATSITQLLAVVDPDVIQDLAHRAKIEPLVAVLKTKLPTEQSELERRERVYAAVKIAWERKDAAEFPELLSVLDKGIDQILRKADDTAWKRLKSDGKSSFELISHRNGQPVEAFDPLIFRFTAGTQALDKTFLVMHGLTFAWKFTVTSKATGRVVELKPFTRGPQVPVFAPFAGVMKPELKLIYRDTGAELDVTHTNVTVEKSTQFVALKGFSLGEGLQLLLAFIIAAITGLEQFYFKSAGFGSLPDYMALFAWGATVDQAKNLLQRTAAPAAPTPATQPPATVPATVPTATPPSPPPPSPPGAGAVAAKPAAPGAGDGKKPAAARGGQSGASPAADAKGKPKVPLPVIPRPDRPATLPLGQAKKPE